MFVLSTGAVLITIVVGVVVGLLAAYCGGFSDEVVVRLADILFSFPAVLLAILVAAIRGPASPRRCPPSCSSRRR